MKIAIVGSEEKKWTKEQKSKAKKVIEHVLITEHSKEIDYKWRSYKHIILISGHCPKGGVDIWAEDIADDLGIEVLIFKPEVNQWSDDGYFVPDYSKMADFNDTKFISIRKGYRSRNIEIAKECDVLYCIVPKRITGKVMFNRDLKCIHCDEDGHPTNGGCWTMKYAKKLGKEVHLMIIK